MGNRSILCLKVSQEELDTKCFRILYQNNRSIVGFKGAVGRWKHGYYSEVHTVCHTVENTSMNPKYFIRNTYVLNTFLTG